MDTKLESKRAAAAVGRAILSWGIVAASLMACGDDGTMDAGVADTGPADTGSPDVVSPDSAAPDATSMDAEIPDSTVTDVGPGDLGADAATGCSEPNDAIEGATALAAGRPARDVIACPGDVDHFAFDAAAGDWVRISVIADLPPDSAPVDTVLTVLAPDGALFATNDDARVAVGRISVNPAIVTRIPSAGRYVVRVLEFGHWTEDEEDPVRGDPTLGYMLTLDPMDAEDGDVAFDDERGDDAASATQLRLVTTDALGDPPVDWGFAVGSFRDATDVDVFAFEMAGTDPTSVLLASVHDAGPGGDGSTTQCGHVWVTDASGSQVIGRIDNRDGGYWRLTPALAPGPYLLWVAHPGGETGANDFYVVAVTRTLIDNPRETDDAANDSPAGAEELSFVDFGPGVRQAFALTFLPTVDDVDYWRFDVGDSELVFNVGCSAEWEGSGVRGFTLEVRDSTDAVLASETEESVRPDQVGFYYGETGIDAPGTYYLTVRKTGQDAEVGGNWAHCAVTLEPSP